MDLNHCFIEHTGNVWRVNTLIKAANALDAFKFYLSRISPTEPVTWNMCNVDEILTHLARIHNAELSIPIILRADGCVMNGWHRIIKAMSEGRKYILAKQFIENPKLDFVLPIDHAAVLRV